jgi:hypothetical protein
VLAQATLHSYAVAYWVAAAILTGGALLVAALYRAGISADPIATDHRQSTTSLPQRGNPV